ncbi:MAG: hypothetical protein Q4A70_03750, partial [Candidatus Saccharibacteria bacterium]|nr:hypothetical protein [Candidatus Saccharibacteria bacterium]
MKIENYYYGNYSEKCGGFIFRVCLPDEARVVAGNVYGREGFPDGASISTSAIVEFGDNYVVTRSGSRYELGEYNVDYAELLKVAENKDKVISEWEFTKEQLMNRLPDFNKGYDECMNEFKEILREGELHEGIMINGKTLNGKRVYGEIISQRGNYVTILVSDSKDVKLKEEEY